MSKLAFTFLFTYLLAISLSLFQPAIAIDRIPINVSPITTDIDNLVTLSLSNIPKTQAGYNITVRAGDANGGLSNLILFTENNGTCSTPNFSPQDAWINPLCGGSGPLTFNVQINPSKLNGVNLNSTITVRYNIEIGSRVGGNNLGTGYFEISPPVAPPTGTFKIDSITPTNGQSLVNPGDSVNILLSNITESGSYLVGINTGQMNFSAHCNTPSCTIVFQIPQDSISPNPNIIVVDPSGHQQSQAIAVAQPNHPPGSLPIVNPNPSGKACTPQDIIDKKCTSSGGIWCDTYDGKTEGELTKAGNTLGSGNVGILTAIGCVPTEPQKLIQGLFRVGIGLGGAAALLLMIGGAFQFITSAGNPDAVKSASETFTQAAIGLLVIIFAVLLLQIIGVDILNIPGFGK